MASAKAFLEELVDRVPFRIHTVLTDNGIQFADRPQNRNGPTALFRGHPFDRVCWQHGIEHRLTQINHPWTGEAIKLAQGWRLFDALNAALFASFLGN
jgi:transposase InsO family protein